MRDFLNHLFTLAEEFLIKVTDAKFDTRNFCYWLNKSVIKSSQENENEIENLKFELNSFKFNFSRLLNFLSDDKQFQFQELLSFFKDENRQENEGNTEFFSQPFKSIQNLITQTRETNQKPL